MPPDKKPAQEARERLSEKVADVRVKSERLHTLINNITEQPISSAEEILKERSKPKFLAKYSKVSTELEVCLNQLLLVTDAISSLDDSDEDADDKDRSEDGNSRSQGTVSIATLKGSNDHETKFGSRESLASVISSASAVDTYCSVSDVEIQHISIPCHNCVSVSSVDASIIDITQAFLPTVPTSKNASAIPSLPSGELSPNDETSVKNGMAPGEVPKGKDLFPVLTDVNVGFFKWQADVPYPVIVLDTYSPMNFYLQLVDQENDIMEQLCMHFLEEASIGYYGGINYVPTPNSFCCAKSSSSGPWYRAKVISIHCQPKDDSGKIILDEVLVKVFFIDEGYEDNVKLLHMRPLYRQFSMLPAQSIKCILGGIQPLEAVAQTKSLSFSECEEMWLDSTISFFENIVRNGPICAAYFYSPPTISYHPPHNVSPDTLVCDLYVVNAGCKVAWCKIRNNHLPIEDHVAFKMITNKMAAHCPFFDSQVSHKNSMRLMQQYFNPENPIIVTENCNTLKHQQGENDFGINVKNENYEENINLPSLLQRDILRCEKRSDTFANDESSRGSLDENNTDVCPRNSITKTPCRLSVAVSESNQGHNNIMKNSQWPANKKTFHPENENIFPNKKKVQSESTCIQSDVNEKDTHLVFTKAPPPKLLKLNCYKFGTHFKEAVLIPDPESGYAKVLVSVVIDPGLFYVHSVTEEVVLLDKLMTELNVYYNERANEIRAYLKSKDHTYEIGTASVVLYSADKVWYRAIILAVRSSSGKYEYEVLFVDFGSVEWISENCVLPIIEEFCCLPREIIACCLADINPCSTQVKGASIQPAGFETSDYDSDNSQTDIKNIILKWPHHTTDRLKSLILTQVPMMVSLKSSFKNSDGMYKVYLYDTADNKDVFINQLLVDEGLAMSDVLTKKDISYIQVNEVELEEKIVEENAMAVWDPMKEQYLSKMNVYSIDTDDPGVAVMGYVQEKKSVCKDFCHQGYCYRGKSCRYVHALPGDPKYESIEIFCYDAILDLPKPERCVPVVIRALLDPTHFWVNFPYGIEWDQRTDEKKGNCGDIALEELHLQMNLYYSRIGHSRKTNLSILAEGELIAAKFCQDEQWYRARVINTADELVQVFYVDYGNTDVITEDNTNTLLPDFLHLPFQAVECFLFNSYMEEGISSQDEEFVDMRIRFRDMVADKVFMAYVVSSLITKSIVVMLYDTTMEPHTYINEVVRGWNGIIHKDVNDIVSLKDHLLEEENDKSLQKISYIPG